MKRASCLLLFLLAAGCPGGRSTLQVTLETLVQGEPAEREEAFQSLTQAPPFVADNLKPLLALDAPRGYPLVAVVTALGEGDTVPLDLLAHHFAAFDWPASHSAQNVIVEPYAWHSVERRLVAAGPAAVPHLARALRTAAPDERKALRVVDVLLAVGGHPAGEALAGLLEVKRDLGGSRVCDVAAAALLVLVRDDLPLRLADRDELVAGAAKRWEELRHVHEHLWSHAGAKQLAARWKPGDPESVRSVFELLVGGEVDDPVAWIKANPAGSSAMEPLETGELLKKLSGSRAEAFEANRRLEQRTGIRLWTPRAKTLGELCASLRLWRPPPGLEVRWRRILEGALIRLTVALVGYHEIEEKNGVIWARELVFPAVEDRSESGGGVISAGSYILHVQSRDQGTRLIYNEHLSGPRPTGRTAVYPAVTPVVFPSDPMKAMGILVVDEVSGRVPPRPAGVLNRDLRRWLRETAETSEGSVRERMLLALGYFQDPADLEYLREAGASAALLIHGDPAGLEGTPRLRLHEIQMGLRRATDPDVRRYLDALRVDLK